MLQKTCGYNRIKSYATKTCALIFSLHKTLRLYPLRLLRPLR
ncbi:MAG TPA: hypothetical protein PLF50_05940 [Candidatus Cloacimonadota bacterium]|nr:hypothetical protein [Candidatus Cloacimonadota bacterium]